MVLEGTLRLSLIAVSVSAAVVLRRSVPLVLVGLLLALMDECEVDDDDDEEEEEEEEEDEEDEVTTGAVEAAAAAAAASLCRC